MVKKKGKQIIKKERVTKPTVQIRGTTEEVFKLMLAGKGTKYISEKIGKDRSVVGKYLKRLNKYGYLDNPERGVYLISKSYQIARGVSREVNSSPSVEEKSDYFRLHSLEIELRTNSTNHKMVKSLILKDKKKYHTRSSGNNGGQCFDVGNVEYMITREKIFVFFPKDWDLEADTLRELSNSLYDELEVEIHNFESRFRISCFKEGRVNFNIRNMHIALVRNGIVKEFKANKINSLVIKDDQDGKPRFIMDFSHGLPELEAIHPEYAFTDADEAKYFMTHLKDGNVRKNIDASQEFFNKENAMNLEEIQSSIGASVRLNKNVNKILERQTKTISHFQKNLVSLNDSQEILNSLNESVRALSEIQRVQNESLTGLNTSVKTLSSMQELQARNLNMIVESQARSQKQIESIATGLNGITSALQPKPKKEPKVDKPDWSYFS